MAFGSSVVERTIEGTHWFDCIDLAVTWNHGRIHHCINVGCSGDTSEHLINRFDHDVAGLQPDIIFIKIGGNDTKEDVKISPERFEKNITSIVSRLNQIGSKICLMTYHSPVFELYGTKRLQKLFEFMEIIRRVSRSEKTYLIDTLPLWENLRKKHPLIHKSMLSDEIHLNRLGNLFLGLIITKALGLKLSEQDKTYWTSAQEIYS
ncbi:MAG: SGNH/GDSL hydrolase family protein, partial [Paracoccaceae bacterium]|nr:SGNH/GDSL hydrolase family protein [Paracoccaceae bacterium]